MSLLEKVKNYIHYKPKPLQAELKPYLKNNYMFGAAITFAKRRRTDLVEAEYPEPAGPEEAVYRGRVYSLSGQDDRFPPLPGKVLELDLSLTPFRYGKDWPRAPFLRKKEEILAYSSRPWKDDRSQEEIRKYEEIQTIRRRSAYRWIREKLPDLAPADFETYERMRQEETEDFLALRKAAAERGRKI